jgi:hypothetical protein
MELSSGHEKIITKSGILVNAGTLNRGFTALLFEGSHSVCGLFYPEVMLSEFHIFAVSWSYISIHY